MKDTSGKYNMDTRKYGAGELPKTGRGPDTATPPGMAEELSGLIDRLDAAEQLASVLGKSGKRHGNEAVRTRRIAARLISAAAGLAVIVCTGIALHSSYGAPKDTFTDPAMAYAEAEKALMSISEKMSGCACRTTEARTTVRRQLETIKEIF